MNRKTIIAAMMGTACLLAAGNSAQAASVTWSNTAGKTNWTDPNSWVGGVAPVNSLATDIAVFTSVSTAQPYINTSNRVVNGVDIQLASGGFNMTSAASGDLGVGTGGIDATNQLSGTNTIAVQTFKFGNTNSAATYSLFATGSNASTSTFNFSSPSIRLNNGGGLIEIQSLRNGTAGNLGIVNISGAISGTNTNAVGFTFSGYSGGAPSGSPKDYNIVNLTENNSFDSRIALNGITLTANSLANSNNNSALGSVGDIALGGSGGVFADSTRQGAALVFTNLSANGSTDRKILFGSGSAANVTHSLVNNDSTYTVSLNNTGAAMDANSTAATRTIQFGGINTGDNIFAESIGDPSGGGKGAVEKTGAGKWVLTGSNTYTGATVISNGTLQIGNGGTSGSIGSTSVVSNNATLAYNRSDNLTASYAISGTGKLTKSGNGTLTLSGANSYSGGTVVSAGALQGDSTSLQGAITNNASVAFATTTNGTYSSAVSGTGALTKSGAGTLTLSGANTYSGTTLISGGTLRVGAGGTAGTLGTGNVTNNGALIFNRSDAVSVTNFISGGGPLTQGGSGTLTLTATNTYTGATTVESGKLVVNGSIASSTVTITNSASLGGSGTVGTTTVLNGATIAPGNSPGTLTINGDLTWDNGGNYDWEVFKLPSAGTAGTDWDLLSVTGSLQLTNLTGAPLFNINLYSLSGTNTAGALAGWSGTGTNSWKILQAANAIANFNASYFNINTANFANYNDISGGLFALEVGNDGKSLYLTYTGGGQPVPEPGTWAAAALLLGGAGFVRCRKRHAKPA